MWHTERFAQHTQPNTTHLQQGQCAYTQQHKPTLHAHIGTRPHSTPTHTHTLNARKTYKQQQHTVADTHPHVDESEVKKLHFLILYHRRGLQHGIQEQTIIIVLSLFLSY